MCKHRKGASIALQSGRRQPAGVEEPSFFWSDLVNNLTGKVPFLVRRDILTSDEAIVGVFGHEMYELEALRSILKEGKTPIEHFIGHTSPGNPGNYHDEAWDYADELVERMRKRDVK